MPGQPSAATHEPEADPILERQPGGAVALVAWQGSGGVPRLASGGDDGTIRIWDPVTGAAVGEPLTGHSAGVWALASWTDSNGDCRLASAGDDGTIRIWDPVAEAAVGEPLTGHPGRVMALIACLRADRSAYGIP
jgi:WD40 repeat protein